MIDRENIFYQALKNDRRKIRYIRNIITGQGDDDITSSLIDYIYFKSCHNVIALDLSKQQPLDPDPRVIQQINLTGTLDQAESTTMSCIIEEKERNPFRFFTR